MFLKFKKRQANDLAIPNPSIVQVGDEIFRMAKFAPEFLWALKHFPMPHAGRIGLAIFSGGSPGRNVGVVNAFSVVEGMPAAKFIDGVLSFDALTPVGRLPPDAPADPAALFEFVRRAGGQDGIPFFQIFKKDLQKALRIWKEDTTLVRTLIFDDNPDVVPDEQIPNVIAVARPDFNDETILRPDLYAKSKSVLPPIADGLRHPVQIARAKYRLVRALGLLAMIVESTRQGLYASLPEAAYAMQWKSDGYFNAKGVNDRSVYERGMAVVKQAHAELCAAGRPLIALRDEAFVIQPFIASLGDPTDRSAVFPWDEIPMRATEINAQGTVAAFSDCSRWLVVRNPNPAPPTARAAPER